LSENLPPIFSPLVEAAKIGADLDFSLINDQLYSNVYPLFKMNPKNLTFLPLDSFDTTTIKVFSNVADNIRIPGKPAVVDEKQFHKNFEGNFFFFFLKKKKQTKANKMNNKTNTQNK